MEHMDTNRETSMTDFGEFLYLVTIERQERQWWNVMWTSDVRYIYTVRRRQLGIMVEGYDHVVVRSSQTDLGTAKWCADGAIRRDKEERILKRKFEEERVIRYSRK